MSRAQQSIGQSVRVGLALTGSADSARYVVEFATSIALARLLLPSDFGIVAVVSSFMQISYVVGNFGMAGAVVQAETLTQRDRHTATTISGLSGLALTLLFVAFAPVATRWFQMPQLSRVMPVMAVQVTFAGLSSVPLALLRRELLFGRVAVAETSAAGVYAIVGIGLALSGAGVWSLVWAPLASSVSVLLMSIILGRYVPWVALDRGSLAKFWRFGGGLTLKNVFVYVGRTFDTLIVARLLGGAATGLYNRSLNLTQMPQTRLVGIVYRVCFPAFCEVRHDTKRFHDWYLRATTVVAIGVTPLMLGLCVVAEDVTIAVLGYHWSGMIVPLRILCLAGLISCLHMLGGAAIEATGRVSYEVATQSAHSILIVLGCLFGARYGIEGVSWGVLVASISLCLMKAFTLRAAMGLPIHRFAGAVVPSLLAGGIMSALVWGYLSLGAAGFLECAPKGHWGRLVTGTMGGAVAYFLALMILARSHLKLVLTQVALALRASLSEAPVEPTAAALGT